MCTSCGQSVCNCSNPIYSQNWYNTQSCAPCSTNVVCKKSIPAKCTFYNGSNLSNLGLLSNIDIELILFTVNQVIGNINSTRLIDNSAQNLKNVNILTALNDINSRLNALEGASHVPYTI